MKLISFLVVIFITTMGSVWSQGSGNAFDLSANPGAKNHLDMGYLPIGETDFTVEFWFKAAGVSGDPAILSNKNWSSGTNTGFNVAIQSGGTNLDINFKGADGIRRDMNVTDVDFTTKWHHIALTFDRDGDMSCYVNGILKISKDISVSNGDITSAYTYKFGQDGTGSYSGGYQSEGKVDEIRVWNVVRTEEEIRQNMSQKLEGDETNLLAYYNFDEGDTELVLSETGEYDATIVAYVPEHHIVSAAAIGDNAIFLYPETWADVSLSLSGLSGDLTFQNVVGELVGVQLYQITEVPNSTAGIFTLYTNETYYGVYLIEPSSVNYELLYDYTDFVDATDNEEDAFLANRSNNAISTWFDTGASFDFATNEITLTTSAGGEFILGFITPEGPEPTDDLFGAGMSLDFDGASNWVNASNGKVTAASLGLPTETITVEAWVKVGTFSTWHGIVTFLQDNGSFERGWDLEVRNGNKFAFALAADDSSLVYLETENTFIENRWYHLAGTYDGTVQRIYVNGQLEAEDTAQSGEIAYEDSWLSIGAYKDDNEEVHIDAEIDEVRIWNVAKTAEEIRDLMCEKADPTDEALVVYYSFDELGGLEVVDLTEHLANGTMTDMGVEQRIVSGAAIGDDSEHLYDADWLTESVSLTSVLNGELIASITNGNPHGIHIYYSNGAPIMAEEFPLVEGTAGVFGVFVADADQINLAHYNFDWDYGTFPEAVVAETDLIMLQRTAKTDPTWSVNDGTIDLPSDLFSSDTCAYRSEMVFITNDLMMCTLPSELGLTDNTESTALINWLNGGSGVSNVQYGPIGFALGEGTFVLGQTDEEELLEGLASEVVYAFYVQDSCEEANSLWVGPYLFSTQACLAPTAINVSDITANSAQINWNGENGSDWTISWGVPGFDVAFGVMTIATEIPYVLTDLAPTTTYEFYIKSNCVEGESEWVGPFEFTTTAIDDSGIEENGLEVGIYPNPSNGNMTIKSNETIEYWQLFNAYGALVATENVNQYKTFVIVQNELPTGVYYLTLVSGNKTLTKKITIK